MREDRGEVERWWTAPPAAAAAPPRLRPRVEGERAGGIIPGGSVTVGTTPEATCAAERRVFKEAGAAAVVLTTGTEEPCARDTDVDECRWAGFAARALVVDPRLAVAAVAAVLAGDAREAREGEADLAVVVEAAATGVGGAVLIFTKRALRGGKR